MVSETQLMGLPGMAEPQGSHLERKALLTNSATPQPSLEEEGETQGPPHTQGHSSDAGKGKSPSTLGTPGVHGAWFRGQREATMKGKGEEPRGEKERASAATSWWGMGV